LTGELRTACKGRRKTHECDCDLDVIRTQRDRKGTPDTRLVEFDRLVLARLGPRWGRSGDDTGNMHPALLVYEYLGIDPL
jgi:hypothetical protein